MGTVAVIDTRARIGGWALAGAVTFPADTPDEVRAARAALGPDVDVVFLGPDAAAVVGVGEPGRASGSPAPRPIVVALPS